MKRLILILTVMLLTSFVNGQTKQPEKKAADTVKKEQVFFVTGAKENFELLLLALQQPGDVTPNQIRALVAWINRAQLIPAKN